MDWRIPNACRITKNIPEWKYKRYLAGKKRKTIKENFNDEKVLKEYLLLCFINKMTNNLRSIILLLNLDLNETRLNYENEAIKMNFSFLAAGVFCNSIKFVKFILDNNSGIIEDKNDCYYYCKYDNHLLLNHTSALFIAVVYTKNRDMIDLLIQRGFDINAKDAEGCTAIMKINMKEKNLKYYDFLISRGANVNLQCQRYGKTVLHYVLEQTQHFNLALHLIEKHGANPYLEDYRKRNAFMTFAIELSSSDHFSSDYVYPSYYMKVNLIEKLLEITQVDDDNIIHLTYELFAACIVRNFNLKRQYFDKALRYQQQIIVKNKWSERFDSIIEYDDNNDDDDNLYIKSVRVFNKWMIIDHAIQTILVYILPYHYNDEELSIYVLDIITDDVESYKKLYEHPSIIYVFWRVFDGYEYMLTIDNIDKYFYYAITKFEQHQDFLKNEEKDYPFSRYNDIVYFIHKYIFALYYQYYYQHPSYLKRVENFIRYKHPINLLNNKNNSILHLTLLYYNDKTKIVKDFISVLLSCKNFKHLNLKNDETKLSPLSIALRTKAHVDIIQLLLDHGSVINNEYDCSILQSLNFFISLQSLAARAVSKTDDKIKDLPKTLKSFVDFH